MDNKTDKIERRPYRRASIYTSPVSVKLKLDIREEVEYVADRYGLSLAEVLRECVEAGLPTLRERLRKREQRAVSNPQWLTPKVLQRLATGEITADLYTGDLIPTDKSDKNMADFCKKINNERRKSAESTDAKT